MTRKLEMSLTRYARRLHANPRNAAKLVLSIRHLRSKGLWVLDGDNPHSAQTKQLETDAMIMALRLYCEDPETFAPETADVMLRWRTKVEEHIEQTNKNERTYREGHRTWTHKNSSP